MLIIRVTVPNAKTTMTLVLRIALVALSFVCSDVLFAQEVSRSPATSLADCKSKELRGSNPEGPDGGVGHFAFVYQIYNSSQKTCKLIGVPKLYFFDQQDKRQSVKVCPNCSDYIYPAKATNLIILDPGKSAHFLLGVVIGNEIPGVICQQISRISVFPRKNTFPLSFSLSFPQQTMFCGHFNVSGWRSGDYQIPK